MTGARSCPSAAVPILLALIPCAVLAGSADDLTAGQRLVQEGRLEEAVVRFDLAIAAGGSNLDAFLWKGRALLDLRRYEEAVTTLLGATARRADSGEAHYWLGLA